ncbi:segregation/condensation protein A [Limibaculum sp. FT325]|uniref:segregation and condensation protein A n=1 Tax=Thermohalobaculum sediminis TaxID=2939436 RepID=UPI0020BFBDF8|nr:ScpA family protein [Limibaculum sediminis]MCL5778547.1 segregation/condensation protein A [Limibaculum sediminis]
MPDDIFDLDALAAFEGAPRDSAAIEAETLVVDVDGFEGPLDLLLTLARAQKVDMRRISVLQLAEQYLAFMAEARRMRIELAADYLVMAAWLAYLKSRLLLPQPDGAEGPSGEELAARLAFQLERLEAMRRAAARLMARDQKGRDFFARGLTEAMTVRRRTEWSASLSDLLRAYARVKTREEYRPLQIDRDALFAIDAALDRLKSLVGQTLDWGSLAGFLPEGWALDPVKRRSALASCFAASLELAKRGEIELRQAETFAPLYLRRRASVAEPAG